ncbi:MAG: leucine-rich repeat protein, partial [Oscillospiraceae bacterium]|nr:leucine-rich repeat protein [Oscillospiraceae bacterium]
EAFSDNTNVKSVVIPKNITKIEDSAFNGCTNLANVTFNEGLKELGTSVFSNTAIETITIPSSLEVVADNQFLDGIFENTKLTTVNFAEGTKSVVGYLFKGCNSITNIAFPETIESIGNYAFYKCNGFEEIDIPSNIAAIGESAFSCCENLKTVKLNEGLKELGAGAFSDTAIETITIPSSLEKVVSNEYSEGIFRNTKLTTVNFAEGTKSVAGYLFKDCSLLENVTFPKDIENIEEYAFKDCTSLNVKIPDTVETIGKSAFEGCTKIKSIEIPDGVKRIEKSTFYGCTNLENVKIPDSVTEIGFCAFADCENLEELTLPKNVEVLEGCILRNTSVKSINIPASLKVAAANESFASVDYAFDGSYIKTAVIDSGMEVIPEGLFLGASKLQTVEIPDTVTAISDHAFSGCQSLTGIKIPSGLKSIGNYAFNGCENLKEIELNEGLESLGAFAFRDTGITEIVIPKTVESIYGVTGMAGLAGYSAFEESNVKEVTFAEGATIIPQQSFFGCSTIEKINIPNTVKTIGNNAFSGCENLKEIELPEGIESIGANAFSGTGITSLTIPASLKSGYASAGMIAVGAYSIAEGSNIKEVTFAEGTKKIPYRIFFNCSTLEKVNLPDSVELIGREAFAGCENLSDIIYNKDSDIKCYQDSFKDSGLAEKVPFKILEDSSETATYGDVNVDDDVTIADAVLLNKYLVDSATLSEQGMANADAYYDGRITSDDTLAILKLIVGTYDSLPVNP